MRPAIKLSIKQKYMISGRLIAQKIPQEISRRGGILARIRVSKETAGTKAAGVKGKIYRYLITTFLGSSQAIATRYDRLSARHRFVKTSENYRRALLLSALSSPPSPGYHFSSHLRFIGRTMCRGRSLALSSYSRSPAVLRRFCGAAGQPRKWRRYLATSYLVLFPFCVDGARGLPVCSPAFQPSESDNELARARLFRAADQARIFNYAASDSRRNISDRAAGVADNATPISAPLVNTADRE